MNYIFLKLFFYFNFRDPSIAKKDLNALENNFKLKMTSDVSEKFLEQLNIDAQFMNQNNIIDYSMLFGIHKKTLKNTTSDKRNSSVNSYLLSSYNSYNQSSLESVQKYNFL